MARVVLKLAPRIGNAKQKIRSWLSLSHETLVVVAIVVSRSEICASIDCAARLHGPPVLAACVNSATGLKIVIVVASRVDVHDICRASPPWQEIWRKILSSPFHSPHTSSRLSFHFCTEFTIMAPSRAVFRALRSSSNLFSSQHASIGRRCFASTAIRQNEGPLTGIRVLDMTRVLAGVRGTHTSCSQSV